MTARGATFLLYANPCIAEVHLLLLYDRRHHSTVATEWGTRQIALGSCEHFQPFQQQLVAVLEASCSWVTLTHDSSHRYYPSLNYEG